jgi:tRNA1(Val) A37 N6-methylase TrmN6
MKKTDFKRYIDDFDFTGLFNQLGWDFADSATPINYNGVTFNFKTVAEKRGFAIMVCIADTLPDYTVRLQLDRQIVKRYREHLLIFCDTAKTVQVWQIVVKRNNTSRLSETRWNRGQTPELLYQKTSNLFFTLDREDNITISDVVDAVNDNFSKNVEKITKAFYENFRKEHDKFLKFISGISEITDSKWYASLMLNRLMFCYFIQKKGFLDNNFNYLKDKLQECKQLKGENMFYGSFYRNFLLMLFHKGLGSPNQSDELKKLIGNIPYLNGGLFDIHELERKYDNIDIEDNAFEAVFNFFDQYNWHLDTRVSASGKDINPDVIGYIFEKYINDRAAMGAYYTKEDITDYIGKNCILPYLFDETARNILNQEYVNELIKTAVQTSGDTYIYDAVKKGVNLPLPQEIEIGADTTAPNLAERRKDWNKPAGSDFALPTEIWRETVERRRRYAEIKARIDKGEIAHINDFITYNLNIRQFAQDVIDNTGDAEFLKAFYKALTTVSIIDPTCGSGAFLFAAMNILEPLYESSLQRMENFVAEAKAGTYKKFEEILRYVNDAKHPNRKYFVYKSIILGNLYGVDIMKEAVEIAKLRLFLKLVATVEADYRKPNLGLEPLPDIDFNIRSGNTLVGYATETELDRAFDGVLDLDGNKGKTKEKCETVAKAFARYKEIQLTHGDDYQEFKTAKDGLNNRLSALNLELNILLAKQYGIGYDEKSSISCRSFQTWFQQYQPFHWFAEFYEIINDRGGFDIIIGNPPYVEYSKVKNDYKIKNYKTESCGNLYAFVMERCSNISSNKTKIGMIVPMSIICTDRMKPIQNILKESSNCYISNFSDSPGLFDGVDRTISILIYDNHRTSNKFLFNTKFNKWKSIQREYLISNLFYSKVDDSIVSESIIPKVNSLLEIKILNNIKKDKSNIGLYVRRNTGNKIFYKTTEGRHYKSFTDFQPEFYLNGKKTASSRETYICFDNCDIKDFILCALNSGLYIWFYYLHSNCRDNNPSDINRLPILFDKSISVKLGELSKRLMKDLNDNSSLEQSNNGKGKTQTFNYSLSKPIIDEIDRVLAEHYGFTEEELDFIINYDIKYRMGKEPGEEKQG